MGKDSDIKYRKVDILEPTRSRVEKSEGKGGWKWSTLVHNGFVFPKPYEGLPKNVTVLYSKKPVTLSKSEDNKFRVSAEEAAYLFATKLEADQRLASKRADKTTIMEDEVFVKNFWNDWKQILGSDSPIKDLKKVDFSLVVDYIRERSDRKKGKTLSEKEAEKKEKDDEKALYGFALVDGVKIGMRYNIEPPSIFIGHGKSVNKGKIKPRVTPEDITINISKDSVPKCSSYGKSCKWGSIVENHEVEWLGSWVDGVTKDRKYLHLDRSTSHFVAENDQVKFEKAKKLNTVISRIREKYTADMNSSSATKQIYGVAVYLLDELAIRPGTEKSDDDGTVGLTTLKCSNLAFLDDRKIEFDFIGKSSIRFQKTVKVSKVAYDILKKLCSSSKGSLFPSLTDTTLNDYLKTLSSDLTAKVFRTWKASSILQKEILKETISKSATETEKKLAFNRANIKVAEALNHKRMSDNQEAVKKIQNKLKELKEKLKVAKTDSQKATVQKSIDTYEVKLIEAESNIATGTSKANYLDPRISIVWAKMVEYPIEKIYTATNARKFTWAMETTTDWRF